VYKVRALASAQANDCSDFCYDQADVMSRLSAPPRPGLQFFRSDPELGLTNGGRTLLRAAVGKSTDEFRRAVRADPAAAFALKLFMAQGYVLDSPEWSTVFGAMPPRGTAVRIARRLGCTLHESCGFWTYSTIAESEAEIDRMEHWYKPGRKKDRRRGIIRKESDNTRVEGKISIWTPAIAKHYARLRKPLRLEGVWKWQEVCQGIQAAQAAQPVHSQRHARKKHGSL